jgi:putative membrane protein
VASFVTPVHQSFRAGWLWAAIFAGVLIWSGIQPADYLTWMLEVAPAMIAAGVIAATYHRFPLTPLVLWLALAHCVILMVGGHYTYAEVPLFDWLRDALELERNNYDKLGHFAQGFVPAMVARELLLRLNVVNGRGWLNVLVVCACLAISAVYEIIEWLVALLSEEATESFLGTQGFVWDTQSDMAWAGIGAISALLLLARLHDRQLRRRDLVPAQG